MDCAAQQSLFYGLFALSQAVFVQCTKFFFDIKPSHGRASRAVGSKWDIRTILIGKMAYGNNDVRCVLDSLFCPIHSLIPRNAAFASRISID